MPIMDIRLFKSDEKDQAISFACDHSVKKQPKADVHFIETDSSDILAFEIKGVVTKESLEQMMPTLNKAFEQKEKINLLARIPDYSGVSPDLFAMPSLFSMKIAAMSHVKRYAIVGAKVWMEKLVEIFSPFISMEIRTFNLENEDKAWKWLKG